jgi:hypothetical protein
LSLVRHASQEWRRQPPLTIEDFERAAEHFNACRARGVRGHSGPIGQTIVAEVIANALDSGARRILLNTRAAAAFQFTLDELLELGCQDTFLMILESTSESQLSFGQAPEVVRH